jgi:hypothetical protein
MKTIIIYAISISIGIGRFFITPRLNLPTVEGSYEAFSHLFVGGLFGAWLAKRTEWRWLVAALALSVFELAAFLIQKRASR